MLKFTEMPDMPETIPPSRALIAGKRFIIMRTGSPVYLVRWVPSCLWANAEASAYRFGDLRMAGLVCKMLCDLNVAQPCQLLVDVVPERQPGFGMVFGPALRAVKRAAA